MKHTKQILTSLALAALALGCSSKEEQSASEAKQSEAEVQLDHAKAETKEAVQAMQDYAYDRKAEFIEKTKKELAEIEVELDQLGERIASSRTEVKAEATKKLVEVRGHWATTKKQLEAAENATESSWNEVNADFMKAYGELTDSFANARQWLSDKIEP